MRTHLGRALNEPVCRLVSSNDAGIFNVLRCFLELLAFNSVQVAEQIRQSSPFDGAMAWRPECPMAKVGTVILHGRCDGSDLEIVPRFVSLKGWHVQLQELS